MRKHFHHSKNSLVAPRAIGAQGRGGGGGQENGKENRNDLLNKIKWDLLIYIEEDY